MRERGRLSWPGDLDAGDFVVAEMATQSESLPSAIAAGSWPTVIEALLLDRDGIDLDDRVRVAVDDPERVEPEGDVGERSTELVELLSPDS